MSDGTQSKAMMRMGNPLGDDLPQQHEGQQRKEEESSEASHPSNPSNGNIELPRCQPIPLTVSPDVPSTVHSSTQIIIAHRGASAHLPEHTLEGYRLALELGADYIEPDLVATADHQLVAMHSLDLSVTTNVEEVFGHIKNKTISKYKREKMSGSDTNTNDDDATGYWVYDFTLAELKQLRLKQRLGGSQLGGRSKAYDGLFQIPTLTEILELLSDWNENIQPRWYHDSNTKINNNGNRQPHRYPPPPRGLYAELKDFPWLLMDANINLIDIFFDHIAQQKSVWENAVLKHMCPTKRLREHEYKLPPLVMQSFEAEVLKSFTERWNELADPPHRKLQNERTNNESHVITPSPTLTHEVSLDPVWGEETMAEIPLPAPPTILLVSKDKCFEEKFWFEVEETYRKVITGMGPDKMCFFKTDESDSYQYNPTIMEKATELGWKVHPWTERPEEMFFATVNGRRKTQGKNLVPFENVLEEILFLKCTVGVHGVFSESVDIAVRAMGMACSDTNGSTSVISNSGNRPQPPTRGFDTSEIPLGPIIGFSFVSGILCALLLFKFFSNRGDDEDDDEVEASNENSRQPRQKTRRAPRIPGRRRSTLPPHSALPTEAADDDDNGDGNQREIL